MKRAGFIALWSLGGFALVSTWVFLTDFFLAKVGLLRVIALEMPWFVLPLVIGWQFAVPTVTMVVLFYLARKGRLPGTRKSQP